MGNIHLKKIDIEKFHDNRQRVHIINDTKKKDMKINTAMLALLI